MEIPPSSPNNTLHIQALRQLCSSIRIRTIPPAMTTSARSPLPITFPVFLEDEPASVTVDFADNADVISATRWRVPRELEGNPAMMARAVDAREFALLAAKRWRHYRDTDAVAHTQAALQRMIATDPQGE